jgi:serine phosphatase RsbU (regulator of sigma subunit)
MMHDALLTDVTAARQVGLSGSPAAKARVLDTALGNAKKMRTDLEMLRTMDLPRGVQPAVQSLRAPREAYVNLALARVRSELAGERDRAADARFGSLFENLRLRQAQLTTTLAEKSRQVEESQANQEGTITLVLVLASAVLLLGWASLVVMLRRLAMRLFQALGREAEQRAVAEQLRRTLVPERLPNVPGFRLAARSRPVDSAIRVGGDWYDVISLPSGDIGLVVGDVVGHDLEAVTAMGQLRAALRACAVDEPSPGAVLTRVNRVADLLQVTELTTCLYAVVNPCTRTVTWSSAGHLNPLAVLATGLGHLLDGDPGPPIGVADDAVYVDRTCQLERQGSLMLYTDGLVERRSASISDNLSRLERIHGAPRDPEALCDHVLELMLAYESDVRDDVTVLVVQAA